MSTSVPAGFIGLLALHQHLLRRADARDFAGRLSATAPRSSGCLQPSFADLQSYRPTDDAAFQPLLEAGDLDDVTDGSLDAALMIIVQHEGPVHLDVLLDRLLAQVRQSRSSARLRDRVQGRLQRLGEQGEKLQNEGEFAALPRQWRTPTYRDWRGQSERLRRLEYVHDRELMQALWRVVDAEAGLETDRVLNDGLHRIGFPRLTAKARQRLAGPLAALLETKLLLDREGTLWLGPDSFRC